MSAACPFRAGLLAGIACLMLTAPAMALHSVPPPPLNITTYPQPTYWSAPRRTNPSSSQIEEARKELSTVVQNLRQQFLNSADYTSAINELKDARQAYQE